MSEPEVRLLSLLLQSTSDGIGAMDLQGRTIFINPAAAQMLGWEVEGLMGQQLHGLVHHTHLDGASYAQEACPIYAVLIGGGECHCEEDVFWRKDGSALPVEYACTPMRDEAGQMIGAVITFRDITARKRVQAQARRHFERLTALRAIDSAILTSQDLRFTLSVVLDQALVTLGGDAASIYLYDPTQLFLDFVTGRGFLAGGPTPTRLRLGEGYTGLVALEGRSIIDLDLHAKQGTASPADWITNEGFQEYYGFPLIVRGQVKGVMEIYLRTPRQSEEDWIGFLETLAGQAAIAIDNAALLDDLLRTNRELTLAYDVTVEGWSRTLELRDRETKGHSARVMELTLRLAVKMGVNSEELAHIRRGALLHDIGKMGVPDSILLKPGPLTANELEIMSKHPEWAYELLRTIPFLFPALDIPMYHHEKWDGTGYPYGLKGEQIPLAARLFAVVDVWDALSFDRPYRSAWPTERIKEHIRGLSGSHFDPEVVQAFLSLLTNEAVP
jgi:PAS domain S-box-containing protein